MRYKKKALLLIASVSSHTRWGGVSDPGPAVQSAIDSVFATSPDYARAELYARLMEKWDEYKMGVPRRIFVTRTITDWMSWYVRTPRPEN